MERFRQWMWFAAGARALLIFCVSMDFWHVQMWTADLDDSATPCHEQEMACILRTMFAKRECADTPLRLSRDQCVCSRQAGFTIEPWSELFAPAEHYLWF